MPTSKVHPLKNFTTQLQDKCRILVLGPLKIAPKILSIKLKKIKPDLIILVDGALKHRKLLSPAQKKILISIGDGDSLEEIPEALLDIKLPNQKDFSDLSFVLKAICKSKLNINKLELLGFSSQAHEDRTDHLIFNLGEIDRAARSLNKDILMDNQFYFLPKGSHEINHRGLFSIISLSKNQIKLKGLCTYQLPDWTPLAALSSRGLSNIGRGRISIECKKSLIVYFVGTKNNS